MRREGDAGTGPLVGRGRPHLCCEQRNAAMVVRVLGEGRRRGGMRNFLYGEFFVQTEVLPGLSHYMESLFPPEGFGESVWRYRMGYIGGR